MLSSRAGKTAELLTKNTSFIQSEKISGTTEKIALMTYTLLLSFIELVLTLQIPITRVQDPTTDLHLGQDLLGQFS